MGLMEALVGEDGYFYELMKKKERAKKMIKKMEKLDEEGDEDGGNLKIITSGTLGTAMTSNLEHLKQENRLK